MNRWLSYAMALMAISLLVGGGFRSGATGPARPEVGFAAPDFALTDLNGTPLRLSDLRGRGVLVNFWATWCPPCRAEMPELQRLQSQLPDLTIVGVDMAHLEATAGAAAAFMQQYGYTWRVVTDDQGEVSSAYGVISIPTSFFIDADGVIRSRITGPMSLPVMRDLAQQVLPRR